MCALGMSCVGPCRHLMVWVHSEIRAPRLGTRLPLFSELFMVGKQCWKTVEVPKLVLNGRDWPKRSLLQTLEGHGCLAGHSPSSQATWAHSKAVEQGGCRMRQSPPGEAAQLSTRCPWAVQTHGMQTVPSSCVTAAAAQPWQKLCCALVLLPAGCCTPLGPAWGGTSAGGS